MYELATDYGTLAVFFANLGTICISVPHTIFWGTWRGLVRLSPRDLHWCVHV